MYGGVPPLTTSLLAPRKVAGSRCSRPARASARWYRQRELQRVERPAAGSPVGQGQQLGGARLWLMASKRTAKPSRTSADVPASAKRAHEVSDGVEERVGVRRATRIAFGCATDAPRPPE